MILQLAFGTALGFCSETNYTSFFLHNVSSATMLTWFTRIDCNTIDKWVNAVCITRNFAYACWL